MPAEVADPWRGFGSHNGGGPIRRACVYPVTAARPHGQYCRRAARPRTQARRLSARSSDGGDADPHDPAPVFEIAPRTGAIYAFACLPPTERGEVA
jgi:hypothetical protein